MTNRLTNAQVARSLHSAGRTVEEIAATLHDTPQGVHEMLGMPPYVSLPDRLKNRATAYTAMLAALRALQDPDGHIWHGRAGGECTGECRAVQEAVRLGEAGA